MSDPISVDNLYQLNDAPVIEQVQSVFANQLESSPSVHSTFFPSIGAPPVNPSNPDWVDNVATALICDAISHSSMYGFAGTINQTAANNYWSSQLAQTSQSAVDAGRALYNWAFPAYCSAGGNTFQQYLNDSQSWGQQLAIKVVENSFINTEVNRIIAAGPNWLEKLNLVLYKLHLLNDSLVQGVVNVWTAALPSQAIVLNWQTYQFIPANLFNNTYFLSQANQAIGTGKNGQFCSTGGLGVPICSFWTDYGLAVVEFLTGKPQTLGFYNGQSPANHVNSGGGGGGGGCFIAGSLVQLEDGTHLPIEELRQDHRLTAKDGAVGTHTDERVIVDVDVEMPLYGFNESEPFFSSGHLFWTRDGWKAFEPSIALEENPSRKVGKLEVGDVVFRIASLDPLTYEEVKIDRFTGRLLSPGEKLYGVHMDGAHSYHVHGFCVAVNYPMITEQRLADGFATLSEAERQHVLEALTPIMPLLRKAVGRFIEKPLSRSLKGDGDKTE